MQKNLLATNHKAERKLGSTGHAPAALQLEFFFESNPHARQVEYVRQRCHIDHYSHCWIWKLCLARGRPVGWIDGKSVLIVRTTYEAFYETKIDSLRLIPKCGEKLCCNPTHQKLITRSDSLKRAYREGKRKCGFAHGLAVAVGMRKKGVTKISIEIARKIRERHASGEKPVVIAASENLRLTTIGKILRYELWAEPSPFAGLM